jgi:hypothetical protein
MPPPVELVRRVRVTERDANVLGAITAFVVEDHRNDADTAVLKMTALATLDASRDDGWLVSPIAAEMCCKVLVQQD